jgi:alkylated DNA repair dioxygenase AlkB
MDLFGYGDSKETANEIAIEGLTYMPNFLSKVEHDQLLKDIDNNNWLPDLKRRVQHYGYKYDYRSRIINKSMHIGAIPIWAQEVANKLKNQSLINYLPDQVIVNEYMPGQGIANHVDCEPCFGDTIVSISLGGSCVMNFTNLNDPRIISKILLEPKSVIILTGDARYKWMHGIKLVKSDLVNNVKYYRQRRVSLTFRKVIIN